MVITGPSGERPRHTALMTRCESIAQSQIGKGPARHHIMIHTAGAVGLKRIGFDTLGEEPLTSLGGGRDA